MICGFVWEAEITAMVRVRDGRRVLVALILVWIHMRKIGCGVMEVMEVTEVTKVIIWKSKDCSGSNKLNK